MKRSRTNPSLTALSSLLASAALLAACSHGMPYAEIKDRGIKALSAQDIQGLLEGRGMSLALPAELNGYPGPMHVLEHASALQLTDTQRQQTQQLMQTHKVRVRELGAQLVDAERALDRAFASRQVDAARVQTLTQTIGLLQARIRADHLQTHLAQTALLNTQQIARYQSLRGYSS